MHAILEDELGSSDTTEGHEAQNVRNHALIHYLATLANSNNQDDTFDFDFVENLLKNGADINSSDKTGQTVFHEVARSWNIDVANFLIQHGMYVRRSSFGNYLTPFTPWCDNTPTTIQYYSDILSVFHLLQYEHFFNQYLI